MLYYRSLLSGTQRGTWNASWSTAGCDHGGAIPSQELRVDSRLTSSPASLNPEKTTSPRENESASQVQALEAPAPPARHTAETWSPAKLCFVSLKGAESDRVFAGQDSQMSHIRPGAGSPDCAQAAGSQQSCETLPDFKGPE